ncbi:hypothetical protein [Devosia sp. 63-57]|uniref:hypothetical protein n=1 Tax=Devosia sp. 63-57 TaxID=1895751 RepID=UPI000868E816|nr:hypothetical protein [Devosia sp. 63-57]ODU84619.1 MAG: hypothetical protein ABT14_14020 [Pelagibacterium sp. SCN 63-17]
MADRRRVVGGMFMLTVLGLVLLVPPVVTLFNHDISIMGMPQIVVYIFGVWVLLIVGTVVLTRNLTPDTPDIAERQDEGDG